MKQIFPCRPAHPVSFRPIPDRVNAYAAGCQQSWRAIGVPPPSRWARRARRSDPTGGGQVGLQFVELLTLLAEATPQVRGKERRGSRLTVHGATGTGPI